MSRLDRAARENAEVLSEILAGRYVDQATIIRNRPEPVRRVGVRDFFQGGKLIGKAKGHRRRVTKMRKLAQAAGMTPEELRKAARESEDS
jgi:hypothetical protein